MNLYLNQFYEYLNLIKSQIVDMLEGNILMLFGAGSNTVLTSLEWATLILATHPNVQNKLQQEIDDIIGKERSPKYVDRNQMPYLQAFMWELWRFRTITPINLPRK
jgi:cytochrome P450